MTISSEAIAQIVGHTLAQCYGVVGTVPRLPAGSQVRVRVGRLLPRERLTRGVAVARSDSGIAIELHVVVEQGLNLSEVAATIRSQVGYELERLTGLRVASIDVHIEDVRTSA